jgi:hypothetical protein
MVAANADWLIQNDKSLYLNYGMFTGKLGASRPNIQHSVLNQVMIEQSMRTSKTKVISNKE